MTSFALKIIALSTMIIDHIGFFLTAPAIRLGLGHITHMMRYIGRIAFPLYAFFIGEGCRHTKNMRKYLSRLFIFALVSEIPFDLLRAAAFETPVNSFTGLFDFSAQNVFFTLFLGALSIAVYLHVGKSQKKVVAAAVGLVATVLLAFTAEFINSDYGFIGVLLIALPVIISDVCPENIRKYVKLFIMVLCLVSLYSGDIVVFLPPALIALLFILLYNGIKGKSAKWAFYLAYPVHMVILYLIWILGGIS